MSSLDRRGDFFVALLILPEFAFYYMFPIHIISRRHHSSDVRAPQNSFSHRVGINSLLLAWVSANLFRTPSVILQDYLGISIAQYHQDMCVGLIIWIMDSARLLKLYYRYCTAQFQSRLLGYTYPESLEVC